MRFIYWIKNKYYLCRCAKILFVYLVLKRNGTKEFSKNFERASDHEKIIMLEKIIFD